MWKAGVVTAAVLGAALSGPAAAGAPEAPVLVAAPGAGVDVSRGGTAGEYRISSGILGETRRILVVLPLSFATSPSERRYPLTLVLDGEMLLPEVAAVSDELARNGQIPESVIVGITNADGADTESANRKRVHDLTPPGMSVSGSTRQEGGDAFLDFIDKELVPALERKLRTGEPRALVGHSSGAILATYTAATRSTYRVVVALDAPVTLDGSRLVSQLAKRAAEPLVPIRYASLEAKFGWPDEVWSRLTATAPPDWRLYRRKLPLEGHETIPMIGAYEGLLHLFGDYSRLALADTPAARVLDHYAAVGAALGAPVVPPLRVLEDLVGQLLSEGRADAARKAFDARAAGYGAPPDAARRLAAIEDARRRPPPAETVESLLATPFPTPDEARAYLGDWTGSIWMGDTGPRDAHQTLRIRVEDGRVIAEIIDTSAPPAMRTRRADYLRVTPAGLTWGRLNGMQPRAVVLFEGELDGDTLRGTSRWGGLDLRDGSAPPPVLHFAFKRD